MHGVRLKLFRFTPGTQLRSVQVTNQVNTAANKKDSRNSPKNDDGHLLLPRQFDVQTFTVFMPDSASARVL